MGERPSEYERDCDDWYVEPKWCVDILSARVPVLGAHDPCCGMGTIPKAIAGSGADLVDRGFGYDKQDFFLTATPRVNIVTNPPYGIAQEIIEHALDITRRRVCALVQIKFLASQGRRELFSRPTMERVIILSRRPSMPPGKLLVEQGEKIRGGGSLDFCWMVWNNEKTEGQPIIEWAA